MGLTTTKEKPTTEYAPVPRDVYEMRLMDIEQRTGQYGDYWLWKWEITEEPYAGRWLFFFTDTVVDPTYKRKAGKIGPRDIGSTLLNRPLMSNELLEGEEYLDLINLPARGSVGIGPAKDGTLRNILESILPVKGAKSGPTPINAQAAQTQQRLGASTPEPVASVDQKLFERYLTLRTALDWTKETAEEMIEGWTEKPVTFQKLTLEERKIVLRKMEELDEANDIPFDSTGEEEEDELTAAGLVSPVAPKEGKSKK